jgi:DNA primase
MARIPDADIQRLKDEISVLRLVESAGVELKKTGKDWAGRCPFHADDTASLVITPSKNLWHCFGCQVGGGVVDWVMKLKGVSFRHAVELLKDDSALAASSNGEPVKHSTVRAPVRSTVRELAAPVALDADDRAVLLQVVDYYHLSLKASPEALAYLQSRGLNHPELIDTFKLGFANRTLGLRLPDKRRVEGAQIRARLERLGVYRASGHEHFNGSLVVPVLDAHGQVCELYGRKVTARLREGTPLHLYLPGNAARGRGVFNVAAFKATGMAAGVATGSGRTAAKEIILCESIIDALTFWCAGFRNVTTAYGVEGFTEELLQAFKTHGIERVLIAYDRDEAGERAAGKLAERLMAEGMECLRIQFPKGMDANEYALKVTPAAKSLGLLVRQASWLGKGKAPERVAVQAIERVSAPTAASVAVEVPVEVNLQDKSASSPSKTCSSSYEKHSITNEKEASPLAAEPVGADAPTVVAASAATTAAAVHVVPDVIDIDTQPVQRNPTPTSTPEPVSEVAANEITLHFGEGAQARRWRVRGLAKNLAYEVLKVNVLVAQGGDGGNFHVDTFDLYAARARAAYLSQAAAELGAAEDVLKADLGRVLLKLEALQEQAIQAALTPKAAAQAVMHADDHRAALDLLNAPDLPARILADFEAAGVVGESTNKLVGYLAAVSRKLDRPLAVVIQSSSAAGKSSLMDAILSFVPEEERIQYSAMTGQSLFYMGQTNLKNKILAIAEEEGASRASYALKLLQSEGELTIASTGTDPATGNLITQEYRVEGPMSLFMTTTAIDIDEELMNRCLVLSVDEHRDQTRAIHQLQRVRRTLAGLQKKHEKQAILTVHKNAQRLLRSLAVVNPYADQLTFLDDRTRTRRDHDKYLTLIDTITLLHQHQRQIKTVQVNGKAVDYIEATLSDIELANKIAHEVLGTSLDELPPQTRRMLTQVCTLVAERMRVQGVPRKEIRFTRAQLRAATASSDTQLKVHLARLAELEYLLIHRAARGQGFEYELLFDGASDDATKVLSGLIDVAALRKITATADTRSPNHDPAHTYDAQRSACNAARSELNAARSGTGRGADGGVSGGGRVEKSAAKPHGITLSAKTDDKSAKPSATPHASAPSSYVHATTHARAPTPEREQLAALAA